MAAVEAFAAAEGRTTARARGQARAGRPRPRRPRRGLGTRGPRVRRGRRPAVPDARGRRAPGDRERRPRRRRLDAWPAATERSCRRSSRNFAGRAPTDVAVFAGGVIPPADVEVLPRGRGHGRPRAWHHDHRLRADAARRHPRRPGLNAPGPEPKSPSPPERPRRRRARRRAAARSPRPSRWSSPRDPTDLRLGRWPSRRTAPLHGGRAPHRALGCAGRRQVDARRGPRSARHRRRPQAGRPGRRSVVVGLRRVGARRQDAHGAVWAARRPPSSGRRRPRRARAA